MVFSGGSVLADIMKDRYGTACVRTCSDVQYRPQVSVRMEIVRTRFCLVCLYYLMMIVHSFSPL